MVRQPPATDLIDLVLSVVDDPAVRARGGSTVVLVPSTGWADRLTARLVRRGYPATGAWAEARAGWPVVVASRAGAWAPVPRLAAAVVLDAHDAAYREESAPTYSAVEVLLERAGREGVPCILVSPVPPVALAATGRTAHGGAPGPSGARGLAGARTGGPPGRRPAHGDVLRGVRAPGPVGAGRRHGRGPRAPGVRVQPDGRRPPAGLPALRGAGPLCPLRCRGRSAARRGGAAVPALRRDAPGRLRGMRAVAHEDAAGRV